MEILLDYNKQVFLLQPDGKYDKGTLYENGNVPVGIFGGEEIEMESIFSTARKIK